MTAGNDNGNLKQFAIEVYKAVRGQACPAYTNADNFGEGVPGDFIERAIAYWVAQGAMERMGLGTNEICLTEEGVTEIESWGAGDFVSGEA